MQAYIGHFPGTRGRQGEGSLWLAAQKRQRRHTNEHSASMYRVRPYNVFTSCQIFVNLNCRLENTKHFIRASPCEFIIVTANSYTIFSQRCTILIVFDGAYLHRHNSTPAKLPETILMDWGSFEVNLTFEGCK